MLWRINFGIFVSGFNFLLRKIERKDIQFLNVLGGFDPVASWLLTPVPSRFSDECGSSKEDINFSELVPADGKGVELDVAEEREAFSALAK